MENVICRKERELNSIKEEIRLLRTAPDQVRKDASNKYKNLKDAHLFKLADEVAELKDDLICCQRNHQKAMAAMA